MPFADKFRSMMDFPFPGDTLGEMTVETVEVGHEGHAPWGYAYPIRLVLRGPGGQAGVMRAVKPLFSKRCTTFSGFGTPYQLWFGKPAVENLGDSRYAVTLEGAGARVHLEEDLARFLDYLAQEGRLASATEPVAGAAEPAERAALVQEYLDGYRAEIARVVGRYRHAHTAQRAPGRRGLAGRRPILMTESRPGRRGPRAHTTDETHIYILLSSSVACIVAFPDRSRQTPGRARPAARLGCLVGCDVL